MMFAKKKQKVIHPMRHFDCADGRERIGGWDWVRCRGGQKVGSRLLGSRWAKPCYPDWLDAIGDVEVYLQCLFRSTYFAAQGRLRADPLPQMVPCFVGFKGTLDRDERW